MSPYDDVSLNLRLHSSPIDCPVIFLFVNSDFLFKKKETRETEGKTEKIRKKVKKNKVSKKGKKNRKKEKNKKSREKKLSHLQ